MVGALSYILCLNGQKTFADFPQNYFRWIHIIILMNYFRKCFHQKFKHLETGHLKPFCPTWSFSTTYLTFVFQGMQELRPFFSILGSTKHSFRFPQCYLNFSWILSFDHFSRCIWFDKWNSFHNYHNTNQNFLLKMNTMYLIGN